MFADWPDSPGVYAITCTATGGQYVGATLNLRKRMFCHFGQLARGRHSSKRMQADYTQHGLSNFSTQILQLVPGGDRIDVRAVEYEWTKRLNPSYGGAVGGNPLDKLAIQQQKTIACALQILEEAIAKSLLPPKTLVKVSFAEYSRRLSLKTDWLRTLPPNYFAKCPCKTRSDSHIWQWLENQWVEETSISPVAQFGMGYRGILYV